MKKLVYIQCSGGIGAQVLSAMTSKYFEKDIVFFDASYFGTQGKNLIPQEISYFDKALSNKLLKFSFFEKNRYFCWVVRNTLRFLSNFSKKIIFLDDVNELKLNYACMVEDLEFLQQIIKELFTNNKSNISHEIVAHIRRGDYLSAGLPLLSLKKLNNILVDNKINLGKLCIVTDSPEILIKESSELDINCKILNNDALQDLSTMKNSKIFVASDSQFSLLAILLSDSLRMIFIPERWVVIGIADILKKRFKSLKVKII